MAVPRDLTPRLLLAVAGLFAACVLYLAEPLMLQSLRNGLFNQYQRWHPRPAPAQTPVRAVDIDEASLARHGQWPWPCDLLAQLLERLQKAGAAVVVFDVLFAEADRSSPRYLLNQLDLPPALADTLDALPDHDRLFAAALERQPSVLGFATTRSPSQTSPLSRFGVRQRTDAEVPRFATYAGTVSALPLLETAASGSGAMTFHPDADGVIRRVPVMIRVGDQLFPSLATEALRLFLNQQLYRIETASNGAVEQVAIGPLKLPTNRRGELWLHYRRDMSAQSLPAWHVLEGVRTGQLEGLIQIVFRHQSTLERIVGDGMAILFSAPLTQVDHQARALACALEIRSFTRAHAAAQHAAGIPLGRTRISAHSDEVVVGNFGGATLFDYRALGDAVNVAARLEGLNRYLGTDLCVSEAIRIANPEVPMRAIGDVLLKGKTQPIRLYEPCETAADNDYDEAYRLLASGHDQAADAFEQLSAMRPDDMAGALSAAAATGRPARRVHYLDGKVKHFSER